MQVTDRILCVYDGYTMEPDDVEGFNEMRSGRD